MADPLVCQSVHGFYGRYKARAFSLWLSALLVFAISTCVRASDIRDDDLKAVYLFRFAMLVDWKSSHGTLSQYHFCVDADNDVSKKLQQIVSQKPQAVFHELRNQKIPTSGCHIIYTTSGKPDEVSALKANFPNALLVGEGRPFIRAGGMMAFVRQNNRIKPLISRDNLAGSPFSLRSQLLSIAVIEGEDKA